MMDATLFLVLSLAQLASSTLKIEDVRRKRDREATSFGAFFNPMVVDLNIPGAAVNQKDSYVCTMVKMSQPGFITKFEPKASSDRVHHMLLYGCRQPHRELDNTNIWACPHHANICGEGAPATYMFAWARNAQSFEFPPNVGLPVGFQDSDVQYYVLQTHYSLAIEGNVLDYTGVRIHLTNQRPPLLAGIYLMAAYGGIIPEQNPGILVVKLNLTCGLAASIREPVYAFAFRVHAHSYGRIISGYRHRQGTWTQIGKSNPQWPQDAQCIYENQNSQMIPIGPASNNEMCNFYIYYYTAAAKLPSLNLCSAFPSAAAEFLDYPVEAATPLPYNETLETAAKQSTVPFGVRSNDSWLSSEVVLGQIGGLTFDANGNLVVFHRGSNTWDSQSFNQYNVYMKKDQAAIVADTVITFDVQTGQVISKWGSKLFYLPHGIHIDSKNNVWLTDVALHQVFKFTHGATSPLVQLGLPFIPGNNENLFCKPSAVAETSDGTVFVADGYCNSRLVQFTSDGRFVAAFTGTDQNRLPNGSPPLGQFSIAHDLTFDSRRQLLYVADRENGRIQVFSLSSGTFIDQINPAVFGGRVYGVKFCAKTDTLFAINGRNQISPTRVFAITPEFRQLSFSFSATGGASFGDAHAIAVSHDQQQLFVGEINPPNKLWRFDIQGPQRNVRNLEVENRSLLKAERQQKQKQQQQSPLVITSLGTLALCAVAVVALATVIVLIVVQKSFKGCSCRSSKSVMVNVPINRRTAYFDRILSSDDDEKELCQKLL